MHAPPRATPVRSILQRRPSGPSRRPGPPVQVAVALLLLLPLAPPPALAGHGADDYEAFYHLNLDVQDLGPGESRTHHLLSPEGPLRAGWIYIIYGGVLGNGSVEVRLVHDNETHERFVWQGGSFHKNSTKIQATGDHQLILRNPGNETVRYAFYYDQSCNCAGKVIPLHGGFVLFNHRFPAGREVSHRLYVYDENITLKAALATYDDSQPTAHWPEDFALLDEQTVTGKDWIEFRFTPPATGTYYVFYEALAGAGQEPVQLTPIIEVEAADTDEAPGAGLVALLVLVGLALVGRRRRQARTSSSAACTTRA